MTVKTGKANSISVVLSKRSESKDPHPRDFPKRLRILRRAFGLLRMTIRRTSPQILSVIARAFRPVAIRIPITRCNIAPGTDEQCSPLQSIP